MLTICAECKTPQECGVVKGYCPVRLAEAQLAASGGRSHSISEKKVLVQLERSLLTDLRGYLECVVDKSMSCNNAEALAAELIEQIDAAIAKNPTLPVSSYTDRS